MNVFWPEGGRGQTVTAQTCRDRDTNINILTEAEADFRMTCMTGHT